MEPMNTAIRQQFARLRITEGGLRALNLRRMFGTTYHGESVPIEGPIPSNITIDSCRPYPGCSQTITRAEYADGSRFYCFIRIDRVTRKSQPTKE